MKQKSTAKRLSKSLSMLKKSGNKLYTEQMESYGQLRGFKKAISLLIQDELDGGELRQLNAIETNTYKMPR